VAEWAAVLAAGPAVVEVAEAEVAEVVVVVVVVTADQQLLQL
jgi:hypothetical protein